MNWKVNCYGLGLVFCFVCRATFADNLRVPADYSTISEAVASASDGDRILISEGRYFESISLAGREIILEAEVPGAVVIAAPDGERGVLAVNGEGAGLVIRGIVFEAAGEMGGGIRLNGAPIIEDCIFQDCRNSTGGGILSEGGSPTIRRSGFKGTAATGAAVTYGGGGGIRFIGGVGRVEDCRFVGCVSQQRNGGGIMQEGGGQLVVDRSTFVACDVEGLWGAAIYNVGSQVTVRDSVFESMEGITLHGWSPFTIERCTFRNLSSQGDCLEMKSGNTSVIDCIFEHCDAESAILGRYYSGTYSVGGTSFCECSEVVFEGSWTDLGGNDFQAECGCPSDLDGDGWVRASDLGLVIGHWGPCEPGFTGDLDANGLINNADLAILLAAWGECP